MSESRTPLKYACSWLVPAGLIAFLFCVYPAFSDRTGPSVLAWLENTWNERNNLMHAYFLPPLAVWMVWRQRGKLGAIPARPSALGLMLVLFAALLFFAAVRTVQPRIAVMSFPFFVVGAALYARGWGVAQRLVFPSCLIYFAVPIPGLLQATNGLQLIATGGAKLIANIGGVEVVRAGNIISSAGKSWGFDVAEGCSGIRSLMVLVLAAAIVGHLMQDRLWKKLVLFASAVPLAIAANAVRVGSVILLAEYGSEEFAATLYHDYSTLIFYPVALGSLLFLSAQLRGDGAFGKFGRTRVRTRTVIGGRALES